MKGIFTGSDTATSQSPSAQAPVSRPSAAETEGFGEAVRSADGLSEERAGPDSDPRPSSEGAPSDCPEPPQPSAVTAVSTTSTAPAPSRRVRAPRVSHPPRADVVAAMLLPGSGVPLSVHCPVASIPPSPSSTPVPVRGTRYGGTPIARPGTGAAALP
ncbi:hypothetical protein GCM10027091_47130 [Streptomyces daliensis]